ncbi:HAD family hydrolase [Candidatus Peregrinibacteria bacterium]|nr:HAD family hydrolase [Candidatus Peregrinibacteria bacterium]
MNYSAILFDLDGTLVDTIDLYHDAFLEALTVIDLHPTRKEFEEWYKKGWHTMQILEHLGFSEADAPAFRKDRDERYERLLRKSVEWLPGAEKLLKGVTKKYRTAVVTGSWMKYVDALNTRTPIRDYIDTFITADHMMPYMKPHPHGLFMGADALNVPPEECLYIGDMIFDLEAAKAAGMESCLFITKFTPHEAKGQADHVIEKLSDLHQIIS